MSRKKDPLEDAEKLFQRIIKYIQALGMAKQIAVVFIPAVSLFVLYKPVFVKPNNSYTLSAPLVLDLDGDGTELYELGAKNIYFDIYGKGYANVTAWVQPDDGLLALDKNGNGRIDDLTELFGTTTVNGFKELAKYDTFPTPHDKKNHTFPLHVLDMDDDIFSQLLIWQDLNSDGVSQYGELTRLKDTNISYISLKTKRLENKKIAKNTIRYESDYALTNGEHRQIVDVVLKFDPESSAYIQEPRTLSSFFPTLRGHGDLKDLHEKLAEDNNANDPDSMISLSSDFVIGLSLETLLNNWRETENKVERILLRWSGSENINPKSRGPNVDARHLDFREKYRGYKFRQTGYFEQKHGVDFIGFKNPMPYAGQYIEDIFRFYLTYYTVQLSLQIIGKELYPDILYDLNSGSFTNSSELLIKPESFRDLQRIAERSQNPDEIWMRFIHVIAYSKGLEHLSNEEKSALNSAIKETGTVFKDLPSAIKETEEKYGLIISSSEDWGRYQEWTRTHNKWVRAQKKR